MMAAQWGTESPGHAGVLTSTSLWSLPAQTRHTHDFHRPLGTGWCAGKAVREEEEASIWKRGFPPLWARGSFTGILLSKIDSLSSFTNNLSCCHCGELRTELAITFFLEALNFSMDKATFPPSQVQSLVKHKTEIHVRSLWLGSCISQGQVTAIFNGWLNAW